MALLQISEPGQTPEPLPTPLGAASYRLGVYQADPTYDLGTGDSPLLAPSVEELKHYDPEFIQAAGAPLPLTDEWWSAFRRPRPPRARSTP